MQENSSQFRLTGIFIIPKPIIIIYLTANLNYKEI
ncbi:hypothetical protein C8N46_107150 [Kordia periserrulae]|uniref:Uncharacterized protein n=1 Tax=Kordia periserrulae TaxID=701523 RepID=A0A2T6BVP2_9FLAO|nr:hypothetical protein C8N46_107150 [Kordia periserrulae]